MPYPHSQVIDLVGNNNPLAFQKTRIRYSLDYMNGAFDLGCSVSVEGFEKFKGMIEGSKEYVEEFAIDLGEVGTLET